MRFTNRSRRPSRDLSRRWARCAAVALAAIAVASPAQAALTHRYSFNDGTANDSVGAAHGTLVRGATVSDGLLRLNNPDFTANGANANYLSLPASILPSTSVTIEQWFRFTGSGFYTEAWAFTDHADDANQPDADSGQYLIHTISNPQPATPPGGANTGGSSIAQSLAGYGGGAESRAFATTPGIGAGGGGYLDNGDAFMAATVIDGVAGTLSYYLFGPGGVGGLQQSIPAIPLSSYAFTNAYLGRSPFAADNATSGVVDEFRIYEGARTASAIAADFAAGPDALVPEPASAALAVCAALGLTAANRRRRRRA